MPCTTGYALHTEPAWSPWPPRTPSWCRVTCRSADPGEQVCSALRQAADRGWPGSSRCARGAFALAAAGLLDHLRAATHWQYAGELAARYPAVKVNADVLWVNEGQVLTSAGLAAGIDLCVQLVRSDYGRDAAVAVARRMVVAPHREGGQAQWLERPVPASGEGLAATCAWAMEHLAEPLTVADLARHAGWPAPRTLGPLTSLAETGLAAARAGSPPPGVREARRPAGSDLAPACPVDAGGRALRPRGSAANLLGLHLAARRSGTARRPPTAPPTRASPASERACLAIQAGSHSLGIRGPGHLTVCAPPSGRPGSGKSGLRC